MSTARMPTIQIINTPDVGTIIECLRGGWTWTHITTRWTDDPRPTFPTETAARCSLLAYHLGLGFPSGRGGAVR